MAEPFDDDSKLIAACVKRDLKAWSFFVRKYSRLISISIGVRLGRYGLSPAHHEVDDIKQAVLTSIWQDEKLRGVKAQGGISGWLAIVSGNAAIDYMRKRLGVKIPEMVSLSERIGGAELLQLIPSGAPDPSAELRTKEILKKVEESIEALSGREKIIAKLNIAYGKKYREIADCLKIPEGTVSSYAKRAKEKLRKGLKDLL